MDLLARLLSGCRRAVVVAWLCFMEARPAVQGIFLLRLLAGAFFMGSVFSSESSFPLLCGAISWMCATTAVYLYNGVQDVEEDRANGSLRPIARRSLHPSQAMVAVCGLGALSLVVGGFVHRDLLWGAAAMLVMGWAYSGPPFYLKRWPAALAIIASVSAILTYNAGYALGGGEGGKTPLLLFATATALWMGLVGQTKDLSDIVGDELSGRRSLPVVWGEGVARIAVSCVALILACCFLLVSVYVERGLLLPAILMLFGAIAVSALSLGPWGRGGKSRSRRPYRAFMVTQYVVNTAVIVFPVGT